MGSSCSTGMQTHHHSLANQEGTTTCSRNDDPILEPRRPFLQVVDRDAEQSPRTEAEEVEEHQQMWSDDVPTDISRRRLSTPVVVVAAQESTMAFFESEDDSSSSSDSFEGEEEDPSCEALLQSIDFPSSLPSFGSPQSVVLGTSIGSSATLSCTLVVGSPTSGTTGVVLGSHHHHRRHHRPHQQATDTIPQRRHLLSRDRQFPSLPSFPSGGNPLQYALLTEAPTPIVGEEGSHESSGSSSVSSGVVTPLVATGMPGSFKRPFPSFSSARSAILSDMSSVSTPFNLSQAIVMDRGGTTMLGQGLHPIDILDVQSVSDTANIAYKQTLSDRSLAPAPLPSFSAYSGASINDDYSTHTHEHSNSEGRTSIPNGKHGQTTSVGYLAGVPVALSALTFDGANTNTNTTNNNNGDSFSLRSGGVGSSLNQHADVVYGWDDRQSSSSRTLSSSRLTSLEVLPPPSLRNDVREEQNNVPNFS